MSAQTTSESSGPMISPTHLNWLVLFYFLIAFSYFQNSSRHTRIQYFYCRRQKAKRNGRSKDCKGKGFVKTGDNKFYLTANHFHDSKPLEFEVNFDYLLWC